MSRIEHQYPEIKKVLEGYETPVHINDINLSVNKNDKALANILDTLYHSTRSHIEKYIIDTYELKEFKVHIENKKTGEIVFSADVTFPTDWSQKSVDVFASKYFIRNVEKSILEAVSRVVAWVSVNGYRDGHLKFYDNDVIGGVKLSAFGYKSFSIVEFAEKLTDIIIEQRGTFNSPVWFNVGNSENPMSEATTSACFVTKIEDNMGSIISQNIVNQMIALNGSGSGCDMTPIRSRREWIGKQQGRPSGPIGFTGMFDAVLQATRSAGRFRRAAGLVSLKQYHPDILEYIRFKANEEKKGRILSDNMPEWDHEFSSESQFSIFGTLRVQNINTAVRLTKEFWDCIDDGVGQFPLRDRNGTEIDRMGCEYLLGQIAQAQLECGDPGLQFDDIVNSWNPFLSMGLRFNSSNACQPGFATILTPNGISTFNDISVGDTIWSGKRWTKITKKTYTGYKNVNNYYTRGGVFVGTDDHKIIEGGIRNKVKNAQCIDTSICNDMNLKVHHNNQIVVDGLVMGDGGVKNSRGNYYMLLYIGKDDKCYFDSEVAKLINPVLFDKNCHRVNTTLLPEELLKTYDRIIPNRFFHGDRVTVCSFLRGLYSANGFVVDGRVGLKATSFAIIDQVQQMLSSIGIRSYYTVGRSHDIEFNNGTYTTKQNYDLNITRDRDKFMDLIGFIHPYKMNKLIAACNNPNKSHKPIKESYDITDVEELGKFDVYEITVDAPEHTYWTNGVLVSNCSELQYLDNSACNLASLKITSYYNSQTNDFDVLSLQKDITIMLMAQDILIDFSYYPTKEIAQTSYNTRNLGLNYGDIGGLLYMMGLPYDSDEARCVAAVITGYFTACAHQASADMAETLGSFGWLGSNDVAKDMNSVLLEHKNALNISVTEPGLFIKQNGHTQYNAITEYLIDKMKLLWMREAAIEKYDNIIKNNGSLKLRNATVTVFVPQGTVGLALGNMTSGIEPFISHAYNKDLVGGGNMKMGTHDDIRKIALKNFNTIYQANYEMINRLNETALGTDGNNILSPMSHIKMMASVQPLISLGISKTCNMPSSTTVEDIIQLYKDAHRYGLKAVTIYVDGSKVLQPLKTDKKEDSIVKKDVKKTDVVIVSGGFESLQDPSSTMLEGWAIQIGGEKFYVKFGWHPEVPNMLWEVWAEQSFCGGTVDGYAKTLAVMASRSFQKGIRSGNYETVKAEIIKTWAKMTFPPNGLVVWPNTQPEYFNGIHSAQSFPNLLAQMIASLQSYPHTHTINISNGNGKEQYDKFLSAGVKIPICPDCARKMVKSGGSSHCFSCICGATVGGCG